MLDEHEDEQQADGGGQGTGKDGKQQKLEARAKPAAKPTWQGEESHDPGAACACHVPVCSEVTGSLFEAQFSGTILLQYVFVAVQGYLKLRFY